MVWHLLLGAVIPFMRAPPSWPNHLPKAPPLEPITLDAGSDVWIVEGHNISSSVQKGCAQYSLLPGPGMQTWPTPREAQPTEGGSRVNRCLKQDRRCDRMTRGWWQRPGRGPDCVQRSTRFSYRSRCSFWEGEEHSRQRNQDLSAKAERSSLYHGPWRSKELLQID